MPKNSGNGNSLRALSPKELESLGLSRKSRRYIDTSLDSADISLSDTLSKRQADKIRGERGEKGSATETQRQGNKAKKLKKAIRKGYKYKLIKEMNESGEYDIGLKDIKLSDQDNEDIEYLYRILKEEMGKEKGQHNKTHLDLLFAYTEDDYWDDIRESLGSPGKGDE